MFNSTSSQTRETQYKALAGIYTLVAKDFRFHECFVELGAYGHLKRVHAVINDHRRFFLRGDADYCKLMNASRNALVCVEENRINKVAKEVAHMLVDCIGSIPTEHLIMSHIMLLDLLSVINRYVEPLSHEHVVYICSSDHYVG